MPSTKIKAPAGKGTSQAPKANRESSKKELTTRAKTASKKQAPFQLSTAETSKLIKVLKKNGSATITVKRIDDILNIDGMKLGWISKISN